MDLKRGFQSATNSKTSLHKGIKHSYVCGLAGNATMLYRLTLWDLFSVENVAGLHPDVSRNDACAGVRHKQ